MYLTKLSSRSFKRIGKISMRNYAFMQHAIVQLIGEKIVTIAITACISMAADALSTPPKGTKSYDFIIDIPSVQSIAEEGWEIKTFSDDGRDKVASKRMSPDDTNKNNKENARIIGLLGYYSKGKSFVTNGLYKKAMTDSVLEVEENYGVTTKGISGVFLPSSGNSGLLLLDTAGRNAPYLRSNLDVGEKPSFSADDMSVNINHMRSKERLIDDMIAHIADTVIYVVDELLNEDQRTILHLIKNIAEQNVNQKLVIVHNFKRILKSDAKAQIFIDEQVIRSFNAKPVFTDNVHNNPPVYKSHWTFPNKEKGKDTAIPVEVLHYVLFKYEAPLVMEQNHNKAIFKMMAGELPVSKRTLLKKQEHSVIDLITDAAATHLFSYVRIGTSKDGLVHARNKFHSKISFLLPEPTDTLENLSWNSDREMPLPYSAGEYEPKSSSFISQDAKRHLLKVDLPGLSLESQIGEDDPIPVDTNYFRFRQAEGTDDYALYVVEGYRHRETDFIDDPQHNVYGRFKLLFKVPHKFVKINEVKFVNSTLYITTDARSFKTKA